MKFKEGDQVYSTRTKRKHAGTIIDDKAYIGKYYVRWDDLNDYPVQIESENNIELVIDPNEALKEIL